MVLRTVEAYRLQVGDGVCTGPSVDTVPFGYHVEVVHHLKYGGAGLMNGAYDGSAAPG